MIDVSLLITFFAQRCDDLDDYYLLIGFLLGSRKVALHCRVNVKPGRNLDTPFYCKTIDLPHLLFVMEGMHAEGAWIFGDPDLSVESGAGRALSAARPRQRVALEIATCRQLI